MTKTKTKKVVHGRIATEVKAGKPKEKDGAVSFPKGKEYAKTKRKTKKEA